MGGNACAAYNKRQSDSERMNKKLPVSKIPAVSNCQTDLICGSRDKIVISDVLSVGDDTGDLVAGGAEGAETRTVGSDSLLYCSVCKLVAAVKRLAVVMCVVNTAERCPVNVVGNSIYGSGLLFNGDRVEINA